MVVARKVGGTAKGAEFAKGKGGGEFVSHGGAEAQRISSEGGWASFPGFLTGAALFFVRSGFLIGSVAAG